MDRSRCACADWGLFLIRGVVGVVFIFHGAQKLFGIWGGKGIDAFITAVQGMGLPYPEIGAWAAACSEFGGGILLIIGLLTRPAAMLLVITMLVAIVNVHAKAFSVEAKGMEYALTLAVVSAGLCLTGAGRLSLDGMFRRVFWRDKTVAPPA